MIARPIPRACQEGNHYWEHNPYDEIEMFGDIAVGVIACSECGMIDPLTVEAELSAMVLDAQTLLLRAIPER